MKQLMLILFLAANCSSLSCCSSDTEEKADVLSILPPASLTAEPAGVKAVRLGWRNTSSSNEGTLIERSYAGGAFEFLASVGPDVASYTDRTLQEEGTYTYRLCAYHGAQRSAYANVDYEFSLFLPPVTELKAEKTGDGVLLTWTDNCRGEEGYLVTRAVGDEKPENWRFLKADATSVVDSEAGFGTYKYAVMAYYGTLRSAAVETAYVHYAPPQVALGGVESSWYMVSASIDLRADGGEACETGICWGETPEPTVEGSAYTFSTKIRSGAPAYGNAVGLEYGKSYTLRGWARNRAGIAYSEAVKVSLRAAPEPLLPDWEPVEEYALPEEVKLYRTTTNVTGGSVRAWYAVADLSTGNVELRVAKAASLTRPTDFIRNSLSDEEVYVVVNGGYFAPDGTSYSYIRDRGTLLASNIRAVTRTSSYTITRGALGVDAAQRPSLWWIYNDAGTTLAYDRPLPVVEGEPALSPTRNNPAPAVEWENYSGVGGAPVLVWNGRMCFDYLKTAASKYKTNYELLQGDIFGERLRAPRTAIGYTPDGKVVLMVCDGRNAGGSQGVTLDELARLMMGAGCDHVLNLDGGGSSMICATNDGTLLNTPSDGTQRRVLAFVGFVKKRAAQ